MNKSLMIMKLAVSLCLMTTAAYALESGIAKRWNEAALKGVRDSRLPAPEVARALAIANTCIYDAWAAYDDIAYGTQLRDVLRRPASERTLQNKEEAISYAAFQALTDVLPVDSKSVYIPLMKQLGFDPDNKTNDLARPSGVANVACAAVLEYRHHDKSNQLGDLHPGPYTDWTGYIPKNKPTSIPAGATPSDPNHWEPLTFVNGAGDRMTQIFAGAQWSRVTPFALKSSDEFRSVVSTLGPARFGSSEYTHQVDEIIAISGGLTDREKVISEFWSDGVYTEQPPGHWMRIAQWISERDHHTLDDDVKFFFVLSNAMMDAGIAAWDAKIAYDSVRPLPQCRRSTAVRRSARGAVRARGRSRWTEDNGYLIRRPVPLLHPSLNSSPDTVPTVPLPQQFCASGQAGMPTADRR